MNQIYKTLFIISLLIFQTLYAKTTLYIIEPDLSTSVIGFKLKNNEYEDYYNQIKDYIKKVLSRDIKRIKAEEIEKLNGMPVEVIYFKIIDYYLTYYGAAQQKGNMKSILLHYSYKNDFSYPLKTYITNIKSKSYYGENIPLKYSIDTTLSDLGNIKKIGRINSTSLKIPLNEVVNFDFNTSFQNILITPDFSSGKVGYESTDKEIFYFSHYLASLCGTLINDDVKVMNREEIKKYSNKIYHVFDVNLNLNSKTIELNIKNNTTNALEYSYKKEIKDYNSEDWNENDEFFTKIKRIFGKIKRDYRKNSNKKYY